MTSLIYNLIVCSVSGTIVYFLGRIFDLITRKRSVASRNYALLVAAMVVFLVPIRCVLDLPALFSFDPNQNSITGNITGNAVVLPAMDAGIGLDTTSGGEGINMLWPVAALWITVAAVKIFSYILSYKKSLVYLESISKPCGKLAVLNEFRCVKDELGIRRRIELRVSDTAPSPFLYGLARPKIVVPECALSGDGLRLILAHELIHYKRRDLFVKLLSNIVCSIHWFNPCVYLLRKSLFSACETYCDETVLKLFEFKDKKDYGRLLISVIENSGAAFRICSTSMAAPRRELKRRLFKIATYKKASKTFRGLSGLCAVMVFVCGVTAFGLAKTAEITPESAAELFETKTPGFDSRAALSGRGEYGRAGAATKAETQEDDPESADERLYGAENAVSIEESYAETESETGGVAYESVGRGDLSEWDTVEDLSGGETYSDQGGATASQDEGEADAASVEAADLSGDGEPEESGVTYEAPSAVLNTAPVPENTPYSQPSIILPENEGESQPSDGLEPEAEDSADDAATVKADEYVRVPENSTYIFSLNLSPGESVSTPILATAPNKVFRIGRSDNSLNAGRIGITIYKLTGGELKPIYSDDDFDRDLRINTEYEEYYCVSFRSGAETRLNEKIYLYYES